MLRASAASICPRCEVRTLFSLAKPIINPASWQQSRFASKQSKRPSRMTLSKNVGRSGSRSQQPATRRSWDAAPIAPKRNGSSADEDPFGRSPKKPSAKDSQFSRAPRQDFPGRKPFETPDAQFSKGPRKDDASFGRGSRDDDGKPRFRRDHDSAGRFDRTDSGGKKPFGRSDSKFSNGPRKDDASFGRGSHDDDRKPRFRRDDDSAGRFDRTGSRDKKPFERFDSKSSKGPPKNGASFGRASRNDWKPPPFRQDKDAPDRNYGAGRKPFEQDNSKFPRGSRNDSRPPFRRDNDAPGRTYGAGRKPFGQDDSKFSRPRRDDASFGRGSRDDSKPRFRRDDDAPGRTYGAGRKPFGQDDSKFSRPRRDDASFGRGSRDDSKPRFHRDDDSPGHLNRTAAPRDLVPPVRKSRRRGDAPSDSDRRTMSTAAPLRTQPFSKTKSTGKEHFHALKMQRTLEPISYNRRSSIKERIAELDDFLYFDLLHEVQQSIPTQGLPGVETVQPTPAQRVAIPALLGMDREKSSGMEQFLLAAETGSGKTLAYMVPVIDAMKRAELKEKEAEEAKEKEKQEQASAQMFQLEPPPLSGEENPNVARPRVIILVPSAELVQQVGALAKSFSHTVKFRAALVSAAFSPVRIRNTLFAPQGVDMVISTPHLLGSIGRSDPNIFSRVTHLVVDEADSLLDRSFSPLTTEIIDKSTPSLKQLIFCSATIPNSMDGYLRKHYPDVERLVTPNIHAIPRRVQMAVVNVSQDPYRGNKDLACAETIHQISKSQVEHWDEEREIVPTKRILVFVNEREKAVEVADYLCQKGFDATPLNRDTSMERQAHVLAEFGTGLYVDKHETSKKERENPPPERPTKFPNTKVLVATDLGSRGIDTTAVRHVILYDVPHTTIDFIHRIGRTGRMGRRGRAIVLLGKGDRADIVKEVRETMFKGQALI